MNPRQFGALQGAQSPQAGLCRQRDSRYVVGRVRSFRLLRRAGDHAVRSLAAQCGDRIDARWRAARGSTTRRGRRDEQDRMLTWFIRSLVPTCYISWVIHGDTLGNFRHRAPARPLRVAVLVDLPAHLSAI